MEGFIVVEILMSILWLIIDWFAAKRMDEIAVMKGHPEGKYFWWCFLVGVLGYPMVIALPDRGGEQNQSTPVAPAATPIMEDELPDL